MLLAVGLLLFLFIVFKIVLNILVKKNKISKTFNSFFKYFIVIVLSEILKKSLVLEPVYLKIVNGAEIVFTAISLKVLFVDFYYLEHISKRNFKTSNIIADIAKIIIFMIAIMFMLRVVFNVNLAAILTPSAILTAIIGLSMQDTIGNLISGLILQIEKPFEKGDWIEVEEIKGEVTEVNWRYTKIKTLEDIYVIIPNNNISREKVINFNKPTSVLNQVLTIGVSYSVSPLKVKSTIADVINRNKNIQLKNVLLKEYGDSSINYDIIIVVESFTKLRTAKDEIFTGIWYEFKNKGIEIPFPIRTVIMKNENEATANYSEITGKIKSSELFSALDEKTIQEFLDYGMVKRLQQGDKVVREKEPGNTMFFIIEGNFSVEKDGKVLAELTNGDFFGEMALLTGGRRAATVISKSQGIVIEIDREAFKLLIERDKKIIEKIREVFEKRSSMYKNKKLDNGADKKIEDGLFEKFLNIFKIKF